MLEEKKEKTEFFLEYWKQKWIDWTCEEKVIKCLLILILRRSIIYGNVIYARISEWHSKCNYPTYKSPTKKYIYNNCASRIFPSSKYSDDSWEKIYNEQNDNKRGSHINKKGYKIGIYNQNSMFVDIVLANKKGQFTARCSPEHLFQTPLKKKGWAN